MQKQAIIKSEVSETGYLSFSEKYFEEGGSHADRAANARMVPDH